MTKIEDLKKLDASLDKALDIEREEKKSEENRSFFSNLFDTAFTALINVFQKESNDTRTSLKSLEGKIDKQSKSFDKSIKTVADKNIVVNVPEVKIPEIKVPDIKLPVISVPRANIQFDTKELEKTLREQFGAFKPPIVRVPKPEVTVNVPKSEIKMPKKMNIDGDVGLKDVSLENPLPVQLRDSKGKPVSFGGSGASGGKSGYKAVNLENTDGEKIKPATEDKQDDIITAVNNVSGFQRATDVYGGGKNAVSTTAVEVTITGTPESIIIKADTFNEGTIYVGKAGVTSVGANALTYLEAGESIILDYDDTDNALYVVGSAAAQNVWWGALL